MEPGFCETLLATCAAESLSWLLRTEYFLNYMLWIIVLICVSGDYFNSHTAL